MLWMADWDSTTSASFWAAAMVVVSATDFATTAEAAVLSPCTMTRQPWISCGSVRDEQQVLSNTVHGL